MTERMEAWRPAVAEFIGTFALVFIGVGSIAVFTLLNGGAGLDTAGLVGVALAHGLAIAVMVMAVGHISGGHFNPAVTVGAYFARRIKIEVAFLYIIAQLAGATAGAALLVGALPEGLWGGDVHLGTPMVNPMLSTAKAIVLEAVLTFFLVFVIFGSAIDERNHMRVTAGLAIGFTVAMDILMGGPLTGAAMNPARAFGPALMSNTWALHQVYWFGPILGGILGAVVYDVAFLEPRRKAAAVKTPEPAAPATPPESA